MTRQPTMPTRSLLDARFVYVCAADTDIRARFRNIQSARLRAEKKQAEAQQALDLGLDLLATTPARRANSMVVQLRTATARKTPTRRAA